MSHRAGRLREDRGARGEEMVVVTGQETLAGERGEGSLLYDGGGGCSGVRNVTGKSRSI